MNKWTLTINGEAFTFATREDLRAAKRKIRTALQAFSLVDNVQIPQTDNERYISPYRNEPGWV